jgi:hypothetical protein
MLWYETTSIGLEKDYLFAVPQPYDPAKSGSLVSPDDSAEGQRGFVWLREASRASVTELVGEPIGEEASFQGSIETTETEYRLTIADGSVIVLARDAPPSEPPSVPVQPSPTRPAHCAGCPHVIILPSTGYAPDMRGYHGCRPHYDADGELVRVVVSWRTPAMTFHRDDGAVTTLNKSEEILEGEEAREFYRYIEQIGLKVT